MRGRLDLRVLFMGTTGRITEPLGSPPSRLRLFPGRNAMQTIVDKGFVHLCNAALRTKANQGGWAPASRGFGGERVRGETH